MATVATRPTATSAPTSARRSGGTGVHGGGAAVPEGTNELALRRLRVAGYPKVVAPPFIGRRSDVYVGDRRRPETGYGASSDLGGEEGNGGVLEVARLTPSTRAWTARSEKL